MQAWMAPTDVGDGPPMVNRASIPDEDDVTPEVTQQVTQEDRDFDIREIVRMQVEVEPEVLAAGADGDRGNRRHAIPAGPMVQHRRLAARRPRAAHGRGQLKAGFIGKHEMGVQPPRFFLIAGHTVPFQWAMACSFRSSARRSGFWHDQSHWARSRPTWVG